MHFSDGQLILSATDLSGYLECPQLPLLNVKWKLGGKGPPVFDDPAARVLQERGLERERQYLAELMSAGRNAVEFDRPDPSLSYLALCQLEAAATVEAMRRGADAIYQGVLFQDGWIGKPDFLIRVERPSRLGGWSYEVVDTKLARAAKGGALLQVLLYADLLTLAQGVAPEQVHLALGGPEARTESFRVAEYAAYYRWIKRRFEDHVQCAPPEPPRAPEPAEHCGICAWRTRCDSERRNADHLSLVAGISRSQRRALVERDVSTLAQLAELALPVRPRLEGVSDAALERVREQARIQLEGRQDDQPRYELLLPVVADQGFANVPGPTAGDLFFDLEADPYALTHGIEYLFGITDREATYTARWALTREEEKQAFEWFVDLVVSRREQYEGMHVYHFGAYEPVALKRLMGRHATREDELDRLLRAGVFIDLHRVVKQGLRASVESYSIKKLEPFYGYAREVDLRSASLALASFEAWLELGGDREDTLLRDIEGYNRDDCLSTLRLADWLESLRREMQRQTGEPLPRPNLGNPEPPETLKDELDEVARLVAELTRDLPLDAEQRNTEQHARWLLAQLLGFHRRENKSFWWEFFRCLELSSEEAIEDRATLGGLEYEGVIGTANLSHIHRYRFPQQEHGIKVAKGVRDGPAELAAYRAKHAGEADARAASPGTVVAIDDHAHTIDLSRSRNSTVPHPNVLVPYDFVNPDPMPASLRRVAEGLVAHGFTDGNPYRAACDMLLRTAPRAGQAPGEVLRQASETTLDAGRRLVMRLDRSALPIQGPPGAGKTYTAARMIVTAIAAGNRVGVTATSHKVISNLLKAVMDAAAEEGMTVTGIQKAETNQHCGLEAIKRAAKSSAVRDALAAGEVLLAAGTAWLWAREDMIGTVDLLIIDEAGQFSLADALAVAPAAQSLVLLGDPRQLEQPQQGVHPPGSDASALQHLLGEGVATVPEHAGLFLEQTWRLHPVISAFTSELFYDGRLASVGGLERQAVRARPPLDGSGLTYIAVEHTGNSNESPEEVEAVAHLVEQLTGGGRWADLEGTERDLTLEDILVIAPYNAQVAALKARLPAASRVGTVDKFQGQEAPIVIYSMATSTPEDAPRGMHFLYSPNRLNVATSRARCLAVVVASPALFTPHCRTPEQMRLANGLCRFAELAIAGVLTR